MCLITSACFDLEWLQQALSCNGLASLTTVYLNMNSRMSGRHFCSRRPFRCLQLEVFFCFYPRVNIYNYACIDLGMVGGLFVGFLVDKFGRRLALQLCNILSVTAGALMCGAYYLNCYPVFHLGRFIIGVNAGLVSGIVPMYLTEISPVRLRGTFGSLTQFVGTVSILLSLILGLPFIFGTKDRW